MDILFVLLFFIDFRCILPKRPHRKCRLEKRRGRKPYKNNTFGCNVEQKAYKINTFENYQIKNICIGFHCIVCVPRPPRIERYCIWSKSKIQRLFLSAGKSRSRIERYCISCIACVPIMANM